MKITTCTNSDLTIQARDEKDYLATIRLAEKICEINSYMVIVSSCDVERWVHICASWDNGQASDFKEAYKEAKIIIKMIDTGKQCAIMSTY